MKLNALALSLTLAIVAFSGATPAAAQDPACADGDQGICDMLGLMLNTRGQGCYRMLSVTPLGGDTYRITCELSSTDRSRVSYTLTIPR